MKINDNTNHNMYGWIFHKNTYTGMWSAAKRENFNELFNDDNSGLVMKSKDINLLQQMIEKTDGDPILIDKFYHIEK